jgi:hypothetical protein
MTTVRFLMRRFYDKSARQRLRTDVTRAVPVKVPSVPVSKPEAQELRIKWGNPVRWHF